MSLQSQLHNKKFKNWANGTIATRYLREGIFPLIDETVKKQLGDILVCLRPNYQRCNTCNLNFLTPKHNKNKTGSCPLNYRECNCKDVSFRRPCPKGVCSMIYDRIIIQHRNSSPNWKNTDIKQWSSNHWEIAKCYMSTGSYGPMASASKTDCSSLISVIINDTVLQDVFSKISPPHDIFTKVQRTINTICNSPDQELELHTLITYIDNILEILNEKCLLKRPEAISAKVKLQELRTDILTEDTTDIDESSTYVENRKALSAKNKFLDRLRMTSESSYTSSSGVSTLPFSPDYSPPSSRRDSVFTTYGEPTWPDCIHHKDAGMARELLEKGTLPSNSELEACLCFGRSSDIFRMICESVSDHIKSNSENFIAVSATYRLKGKQVDPKRKIHVVFVAITTNDPIGLDIFEYHIYVRRISVFSREDKALLAKELSDDLAALHINDSTIERLRQCIATKADDLMRKHSNLSVILPSFIKSQSYGSDYHRMIPMACIRLYVSIKGYIPVGEDPFPEEIDGFRTDVVEGEYGAYSGGPNDFHEHLKIGVAVHANVFDSNQEVIGGTLTGFVDHPVFGLCGITSAHVLCTSDDLEKMKRMNLDCFHDKQVLVFQPVPSLKPFGKVVKISYSEGNDHDAGMEVALFQINERHPTDGSFPEASNYEEADHSSMRASRICYSASGNSDRYIFTTSTAAGFDEQRPLTYHSGEVCETSEIGRRTEVFKFGIGSGVTRGSFHLKGAVIRRGDMTGKRGEFGYCLKNQMAILQIGEKPFATYGDSGALILKEGESSDSVAVGIVEGGLGGRVYATPICDVLRAVGCSSVMMKRFSTCSRTRRHYTGGSSNDSGTSETMDVSE